MSELEDYKTELFNEIDRDATEEECQPAEVFFRKVTMMLEEEGAIDNIEYTPFRRTPRGIQIDGWGWNETEKTIYGVIVTWTNQPDRIETITNTKITDNSKRVTRFFERIDDQKFLQELEITDPGYIALDELNKIFPEAIKFRIFLITDEILSNRVKKISIEQILGKDTDLELWDLERIKGLEENDNEFEEFTVDAMELGEGIKALPSNVSKDGSGTYLGVMPGDLLSAIFKEFGQRLLESNVRTFLDFRSSTNKGMKNTLLKEPENFFAYNNGLTVTATSIKTVNKGGQLLISELENMQIVNGGQTTASVHFTPWEKGGVAGENDYFYYKDIDLKKVNIQMKLTVTGDDKDSANDLKAKIAQYANTQNAIQQSDLVSNHPFHLEIESRSRQQYMPAGEIGYATKWFYERARGQYSTKLRERRTPQMQRTFQREFPKDQLFTKTDMAKYENTWRLQPHIVKKGAQANLKALGPIIVKEYEKQPDRFGAAFYKDLVAKMILYRKTDKGVATAEWYKLERGLKVEAVTFALALFLFNVRQQEKELNLEKIFQAQSLSSPLLDYLVELSRIVRNNILDDSFKSGVQNPSEFCKSEKGWEKIKTISSPSFSSLHKNDLVSGEQIHSTNEENRHINETGRTITDLEEVMAISQQEWSAISNYFAPTHGYSHRNVNIPEKCVKLHISGAVPSVKQIKEALRIRKQAYEGGFNFIS